MRRILDYNASKLSAVQSYGDHKSMRQIWDTFWDAEIETPEASRKERYGEGASPPPHLSRRFGNVSKNVKRINCLILTHLDVKLGHILDTVHNLEQLSAPTDIVFFRDRSSKFRTVPKIWDEWSPY